MELESFGSNQTEKVPRSKVRFYIKLLLCFLFSSIASDRVLHLHTIGGLPIRDRIDDCKPYSMFGPLYIHISTYIYNIYTYIHACMHACMHAGTHARTHARTHASRHPCIHASMHACTHARTHASRHPCIHASMHPCTHACMHACMHTHIRTYIHTYIHT